MDESAGTAASEPPTRILLVEDLPTQAFAMCVTLEDQGFDVAIVEDVKSAIDAIARQTPT